MSSLKRMIVVWDPAGELLEGDVRDPNDARVRLCELRGGVLLPVEQDVLAGSAAGGFFFRRWGQGAQFSPHTAGRLCPMILHVGSDCRTLTWAARLIPEPGQPVGDLHGQVRLVSDNGQAGVGGVGLQPEKTPPILERLGPPDKHGGWTVGGKDTVALPGHGFVGVCLYGNGAGCRVAWSAVSLSRA